MAEAHHDLDTLRQEVKQLNSDMTQKDQKALETTRQLETELVSELSFCQVTNTVKQTNFSKQSDPTEHIESFLVPSISFMLA